MDFITDLPKTKSGNTTILTCIDAATRRGRFMPCKLAVFTAEKAANLVRQGVIRQQAFQSFLLLIVENSLLINFRNNLDPPWAFKNCPPLLPINKETDL